MEEFWSVPPMTCPPGFVVFVELQFYFSCLEKYSDLQELLHACPYVLQWIVGEIDRKFSPVRSGGAPKRNL